jgi:predicted pyridoxine 5'-phosphate oxidase superfamily flavin-nucleotide-binding protein
MSQPKMLQLEAFIIFAALFATACGLSPQEIDATSTQIAESVFATETASAPTPTTVPTNTPTNTPVPSNTPEPTNTYTPYPTMTKIPTATKVLATATASMTTVKVINNLNVNLKITMNGPTPKSFTVNAHSTFEFQCLPGRYSYQAQAIGFVPNTEWITIPPGEIEWTWGKVRQ